MCTESDNINTYKQNRDDVTCNIKVEIEIDVHISYKTSSMSDEKETVKRQVLDT